MFYLLDPEKWERQKHFEDDTMRLYCYSTSRCGKSVSAGQKMWIKVLSGIYLLHRKSCQ